MDRTFVDTSSNQTLIGKTLINPNISGPLTTDSSTLVANLNASQLESKTWEAPGTIGSSTPNTVHASTLIVDSSATISYLNSLHTGDITSTDIITKGPRVDVRYHGADPTGAADSGTAFVNAYARASAINGWVYAPAGTYKITSAKITPVSNTGIIGDGKRQTIINWNGTGFWLDDTSNGTIQTDFTLQGMSINVSSAGTGAVRIGDITQTAFSENNQHIDYALVDLLITGNTGAIVAGSRGVQLATFIRTRIEECLVFDFDINWEFKKFDVGYVKHNRLQRFTTYGMYLHNDMSGGGGHVADETVFIQNEILEIPATSTAAIYLQEVENIRFNGTYFEPKSGDSIPVAWKFNAVYNLSIDGATISTATQLFNILDGRTIAISHVGLQNMDANPAPTSVVAFTAGNDASGTAGGIFAEPRYGLIKVKDCAYLVNNSFKGQPGVSISGMGLYGPGESHFGGMISDVSNLYSTQILDRNGAIGLIKESSVVLSPFSANTYLMGSDPTGILIVTDASASTGYALKVPTANFNIFMDIPYPNDILPGAYEIVARLRTSGATTTTSIIVRYDNINKENDGSIALATTYRLINYRFNFAPAGPATTLSIRISANEGTDLFVDYIILRPCINSLSLQAFVANDITFVGSDTTPGYKIIYKSAAPPTGTWSRGDITFNTAPANPGNVGWVCTAAGTPGTWVTFGSVGNQILGTTTNDNAASGYVGEYIRGASAAAGMSNGTYVNITSIALTAGDWSVTGIIQADATSVVTRFLGAVSAFSGNTTTDHTGGDNVMDGFNPTAGSNGSIGISAWRVSIASPTTIYLKARLSFGSGSPTATGRISAIRVR
jgi:hypothetical protein